MGSRKALDGKQRQLRANGKGGLAGKRTRDRLVPTPRGRTLLELERHFTGLQLQDEFGRRSQGPDGP